MQPTTRRLRPSRSLAFGRALGPISALALGAGAAQGNPMQIGNPYFEYEFEAYRSDGQGGSELDPDPLVSVTQHGGVIFDTLELGEFQDGIPELEVFSNAGAETFWVAAEAPHALPPPILGDPVGARSFLQISQSFVKDESDASLSYTINGALLRGLDSSPAGDPQQVYASIGINVLAYHGEAVVLSSFSDGARLEGLGRANDGPGPCDPPCWSFEAPDHLSMAVSVGALDQGYVEIRLTAPFRYEIDLSALGLHEEVTVIVLLSAFAEDTAQVDTGGAAFLRDPSAPDSGSYFEYTGLTPTDNPIVVPEPSGPVLLLAGLGVLLGAGSERRSRSLSLRGRRLRARLVRGRRAGAPLHPPDPGSSPVRRSRSQTSSPPRGPWS